MAITVRENKKQPYYVVTNEYKDNETTLGFQQKVDPTYSGIRDQVTLSLKDLQDPFKFKWDGIMHTIPRGASETLREGIVKHLVGDWDLEDIKLWEAEQRRVLSTHGFIPKLKLKRLLTDEEKEEQAMRYQAESRYARPVIDEVQAETAPAIPKPVEETQGFSEDVIEEAERKKPGRPKKKAD